jgi:hypothetical protein
MDTDKILNKYAEVRKIARAEDFNTLIKLVVLGLVLVMIVFGWAYPNFTILKVLFMFGLFILAAVIITKRTWFPKEFERDAKGMTSNIEKNLGGNASDILPPKDVVMGNYKIK